MQHGDIGNQSAPIIAICVDDLLYNYHERSGIFSSFLPPKREVNCTFLYRLNWIWLKTKFAIYLVSFKMSEEELLHELEGIELNFNYTRAVSYKEGGEDLARQDISYSYHLFVDTDEDRLTRLSCSNTRKYAELESSTGMDGRRFF